MSLFFLIEHATCKLYLLLNCSTVLLSRGEAVCGAGFSACRNLIPHASFSITCPFIILAEMAIKTGLRAPGDGRLSMYFKEIKNLKIFHGRGEIDIYFSPVSQRPSAGLKVSGSRFQIK